MLHVGAMGIATRVDRPYDTKGIALDKGETMQWWKEGNEGQKEGIGVRSHLI